MNLDITRDELRKLTKQEINSLLLLCREYWVTAEACVKVIQICDKVISIFGDGALPLCHSTKLEAAMRGKVLAKL